MSLAETMLAILILLAVSIILANGVSVVQRLYNDVVVGANARVLMSTAITALRNELGTARDVKIDTKSLDGTSAVDPDKSTTVLYYNNAIGAYSRIGLAETDDDAGHIPNHIVVLPYINPDSGEPIKTDAQRDLVSIASANGGWRKNEAGKWKFDPVNTLYVTYEGLSYNPETAPDIITFKNLRVCKVSDTAGTNPLVIMRDTPDHKYDLSIRIITESGAMEASSADEGDPEETPPIP